MKGQRPGDPTQSIDSRLAEFGHELGNVVHGLIGMAGLLRETNLNPRQAHWARAIDESGRQLQRLLERLVRAAEYPAQPQPVELDGIDLLEQIVLRHVPGARESGNRLLLTVAPGLQRRWFGDPCLLPQLLDNLVANAVKYTRAGEVRVEARPLCPGRGVEFRVCDTGPGIEPTLGGRIFEAGVRGRPGIADEPAGYGLGLYVCGRIVRAMGGDIDWNCGHGGGTTFRVALPGLQARRQRPARRRIRLLESVHCAPELDGTLQESVCAWLDRLGVRRRAAGASVRVAIREWSRERAPAGPHLQITADYGEQCPSASLRLEGPVLETNLAAALLELALVPGLVKRDRRG